MQQGVQTEQGDFLRRLDRFGDRPALLGADGTAISYRNLDAQIDAVAEELGSDRRLVLLEASTSVATVVGYLGALRAGSPVLVAGGEGPLARNLLERYDPDVVVAASDPSAGAPSVAERRRSSAHRLHPELALLLSTSGSTGSPKLVRLSRSNLTSNAAAIADYLRLTSHDVAQTTLPLHYCYGLSQLHSHLSVGAAVVLSDLSVTDACFWRSFREHGATNFAGVPHTFELLERVGFEDMDLPRLRFVTQAGGRMAPAQVQRFAELGQTRGWELFVMYGQTEATARMAYLPPEQARERPAAIGRAIPGGELRVEALTGVDLDEGVGELVYRGPNVMLGYAEQPGDLALGRTVEELRTGDLARCGEDGLFEIVGRRARFLKLFGLRVDLDQVEASLASAGATGCVTGDDRGLVVVVTDADPTGVHRWVARWTGLPLAAIEVHLVLEVPRLPTGKVDHLAVLALRPSSPRERPAAASDVAGSVRRLYARMLDVDIEEVGEDDSFVRLGGDSLSYVEVCIHLESILGQLPAQWQVLPIRDLVPAASPSGRRRVETSVLLRALGILLVVATHATPFEVRGGAHVLLAVTGFNFARFQLAGIRGGAGLRQLRGSIARVVVPAVAWIGVVAVVADGLGPANVLLVNGLVGGAAGQGLWKYWYIEVVVHLLVGLALLFRSPRIRHLERASPLLFAWAVLAVAMVLRSDLLPIPGGGYRWFQVHGTFWLFALGWVAAESRSWRSRLLLSVVTVGSLAGSFPSVQRQAVVALGILVLVWLPTVRVPAPLHRPLGAIAGASLFIYLLHWQVLDLMRHHLAPLPTFLVALLAGLGGSAAWAALTQALATGRSRRARGRLAEAADRRSERSAG